MSLGKFPLIYDWSDMPKFWPAGKKEEKKEDKDGDPGQEASSRPVEKGRRRIDVSYDFYNGRASFPC